MGERGWGVNILEDKALCSTYVSTLCSQCRIVWRLKVRLKVPEFNARGVKSPAGVPWCMIARAFYDKRVLSPTCKDQNL